MTHRRFVRLIGFLALLATAGLISAQERDSGAVPLFLTHCASCHGEKGDGDGTTQLDRRARSFQDGGFSYGNTVEAIVRTLTHGIPGTPMPSFDGTLNASERRALAHYVRSLGPPITEVSAKDTILVVRDRPAIVRGFLPPIAAGAESHARGLLIGTPDGMSFEYRTDDVRLLGVRQGGFVERTDWIGRGGSALRPLGQVIHTREGGLPGALFRLVLEGGHQPLAAEFTGTWIRGAQAGLGYRLRVAGDPQSGTIGVRESCRARSTSVATGFERSLALNSDEEVELELRLLPLAPGDTLLPTSTDKAGTQWFVVRRASGSFELLGVRLSGKRASVAARGPGIFAQVTLPSGGVPTHVSLSTLLAFEWNEATQSTFLQELSR